MSGLFMALLKKHSIYVHISSECYLRQAHLLDGRASAGTTVDSARQNLAATFVNAGFGQVSD